MSLLLKDLPTSTLDGRGQVGSVRKVNIRGELIKERLFDKQSKKETRESRESRKPPSKNIWTSGTLFHFTGPRLLYDMDISNSVFVYSSSYPFR